MSEHEPEEPVEDIEEPEDELGEEGEDESGDAREYPESRPRKPRVLPHLTQDDLVLHFDEFGRKHYSLEDGRPVCGRLKKAKNRLIENEACLGPPMANGACKVHGGKAGRPIQHGRYSRVLQGWRPAFEAARQDKDLTDSRRELALMDVGIEKLLVRVEQHDCPGWRVEVLRTFRDMRAAIRGQRQSEVGALLNRLGDLLERGATADQVTADLVASVDRRANRACRVTELAIRREEKLTVSEVAAIFGSWLAVLEKLLEPEDYYRVVPELRRVSSVGQPGDGAASDAT